MRRKKEKPERKELTPEQKELVAHIKLAIIRPIVKLDDYEFWKLIEKAYKEGQK